MTSDLHSEMLNLELGEASMELQGVPVRGVTAWKREWQRDGDKVASWTSPFCPFSMSHCKCPWYGQTFPIQYQTEEGSRPEMSSTLLLLRYYQPDSSTLCRSLLGLILTNSQGLYQTTTSIRAVWRMLAKSTTNTTCVLTKGFHSGLVPLSLTHETSCHGSEGGK